LAGVVQDGIEKGVFRNVPPYLVAEIFNEGLVRLQDPRVLRNLSVTEADAFMELTGIILLGIADR
jgi:hypothetical protein